jgi:hypothetical protein
VPGAIVGMRGGRIGRHGRFPPLGTLSARRVESQLVMASCPGRPQRNGIDGGERAPSSEGL